VPGSGPPAPAGPHAARERRLGLDGPAPAAGEGLTASDGWERAGGLLRTRRAGASLKVEFRGNRIDLIARKGPGGGTARVRIDGVPADQAPAFAMNYILPKPGPGPPVLQGPGPGDVAPHAVRLGAKVVPQSWTIAMTGDMGEYRLVGGQTGFDGEGNSTRPFLSRSGQVAIDPELWRHNKIPGPGGSVQYGNRAGDRFTFDVERTATVEVAFRAEQDASFSAPLARNLANGRHTAEVVAAGDGLLIVEGFYVWEPPLKE
jgi:hypothetical protein